MLVKNSFSLKAIAKSLEHAKEIITVDVYTDTVKIILGSLEEMEQFAKEIMSDGYFEENQAYLGNLEISNGEMKKNVPFDYTISEFDISSTDNIFSDYYLDSMSTAEKGSIEETVCEIHDFSKFDLDKPIASLTRLYSSLGKKKDA